MFFFEYGVIVFWNMSEMEEKSIISELKHFEIKSNQKIEYDNIKYEEKVQDEEETFVAKYYINRDHLVLCVITIFLFIKGSKFEEKLAVSYALAQSSKLDYFEEDIDYSIADARSLAEELAKFGYITLDHKSLNKKIGRLYLKKNEINLDTDILDTPDYFWDNDKYQTHFATVVKYFEISKRTEVINHRLGIIGVYNLLN